MDEDNYAENLTFNLIIIYGILIDLDKGLNIDGKTLTNLRFADDVALTTNNMREMEEQLNRLNKNSKNIGLKMHKGKTKYMTNFQNDQEIHIESEKIEEVTNYKYLGQATCLKDTTKEKVTCRIRAGWSCFAKNREIFQDDKMPLSLKTKGFVQQQLKSYLTYKIVTHFLPNKSFFFLNSVLKFLSKD